ncbi:hypothetical protein LTR17_007676 [Elasticomyces elasticus]|nr:hypothetical protein LTR17_007676 [Elasticomyces elasticus]
MPLLYGEGKQAFIRIQEEIVRKYTDDSILAWDWRPDIKFLDDDDDEIFAAKPSMFLLGADRQDFAGTQHWKTETDTDFELTNNGLRLTARIVSNFHGCDWAILNYSLQHDLTGPLALPLDSVDSAGFKYTIAGSQGERCVTIPLELVSNAVTRTITLMSWTKGSIDMGDRSLLQNINFRINVFNGRREVVLLESKPVEHCERNFVPMIRME